MVIAFMISEAVIYVSPAEIAEIAEIKMPIEAIECERIPKEHRRKPQGTPKEHRRMIFSPAEMKEMTESAEV
jgi:hypothetical protein